jgi:hypothetical protein
MIAHNCGSSGKGARSVGLPEEVTERVMVVAPKGARSKDSGFGTALAKTIVMSDYIPDTPAIGRMYCPGCEPEVDPMREILDVRWCESHAPKGTGLDDAMTGATLSISGSGEAGGEDNRRWCAVLHRRR